MWGLVDTKRIGSGDVSKRVVRDGEGCGSWAAIGIGEAALRSMATPRCGGLTYQSGDAPRPGGELALDETRPLLLVESAFPGEGVSGVLEGAEVRACLGVCHNFWIVA